MSDSTQWAVKYRPQTIEEFVGQPAAVAVIKGWAKTGKIPGCVGVFGPSGVGKTTLARLAAGLFSGGNSDPKKNPDIEDVPPAERGVGEVRELIQRSQFNPRGGKRRCIIINEAHVYTVDAQKTLLSAVEEPAPKTTWLLCTDQPERLLRQLAMRVQPVTLGTVPDKDIKELLGWVLDCEKANFGKAEDAILNQIVEASYGVPRQAVQILDLVNTAIVGGGKPSDALKMAVRTASATDAFDASIKFITALLGDDQKAAVSALNETGACDGMLHLSIRMLSAVIYVANGGKPKDGLGWAAIKAIGVKPELNRVLALQAKMCGALDMLTRSNFQVPAEAILLSMVKK
jgi:DNA polymerase III gamma/tau subunit